MFLAAACGSGDISDPATDAAGTRDGGSPDGPLPEVIVPDDPGPADVRFDVHSQRARHAISPYIYGHNQPEWDGRGARLTLARSGGNRWTAYNWETNASNAGEDYFNQNDGYLGGGDTPGEAVRAPIAASHARGAAHLITVPIAGYVAADKNGGGDVNQTPDYLNVRFHDSVPAKGAPLSTTPDLGDGVVYQDEYVAFLAGAEPDATVLYSLDNEPDLWASTHPRIHPDPVRYDELVQRNLDYAAAIKDVVPDATVFGFVSYGWNGYVTLQDAPDGAGRDFIDFYLGELAAADAADGRRLVDVLDVHWYPEAQGGGQRIVVDDASAAVADARIQAPRSLWDDSYVEQSWITEFSTGGPIALLPRLRAKIAAHYPGTELAITEYYYGGGADISGAIAQADVLGIFGREGVFAAALWHLGSTDDAFIWAAFAAFRDYDGAGGAFGATSIEAVTDDVEASSIYASVDGDRVVLVAINKSTADQTAGIAVTHHARLTTAAVYQLTAASPSLQPAGDLPITLTNAFTYTMPARSVTVLVLAPG